MKNLKELTILHSNDMHGDFLAEQIDEKLVGGVSLLSGYVNMVRRQEKMYFMPLPEICFAVPLLIPNTKAYQPSVL
jgi:2',3'-cyclic-nucleotide 2'-phosphodiesterase (5'-nucleotidase family)